MMLNQKDIESFKQKFNTFKIIAGALPAGCIFALVIFFVIKQPPKFVFELTTYAIIGIAFAAGSYMASFIVPLVSQKNGLGALAGDAREKEKGGTVSDLVLNRILGLIQTTTIIRFALIEGAMFLNMMLWFLDGNAYSLIVVFAGLFLMLICFPTESKTVSKLESMATEIETGFG